MKCSLTDLHTHILPSFDDGAESMDVALEMLRLQKENGVERVALTPHYYPHHEDLNLFINRRQKAYKALLSCWDEKTMPQLCLGAEVRYTPKLAELDLHQLTFGNSKYMLLELPSAGAVALLDMVVESIFNQGIIPVFAHVERCATFRAQPDLLEKFVKMGALAQVSVSTLLGKGGTFAKACLKKGLVHIISSDAHSLNGCVDWADIKKPVGIIESTEKFARAIWDGTPLPSFVIKSVKKSIFGYL